jgi:uncharacterized membrane protein
MNPILRTRILIVLAATGIFLMGGITGSLITLGLAKKNLGQRIRNSPETSASIWIDKLDKKLDLTPEQETAFKPVLEDSLRELQTVRRRALFVARHILENAESRLFPELSDRQREQYEELKTARRDKIRDFLGEPSSMEESEER